MAGLAALMAVLGQAQADTYVTGSVFADTWTKANSPYRVTGDIQVNGPLTIQPGVRVLFQGSYTFEVQGKLFAVGSASDPIVFAQGSGTAWKGIFFNYSQAGSQLIHCAISNAATSGIRLFNPQAAPQISRCILANHAGAGISATVQDGGLVLADCTFIKNTGSGLWASLATGDLFLTNCTFLNNTTGDSGGALWANVQAGNLILTNCAFTNNSAAYDGGGVYAAVHNRQLRLGYCRFQGNSATPDYNVKSSRGGGFYVSGDSVLNDCLFLNNTCKSYSYTRTPSGDAQGGGAYSTGGDMALLRCTFTGNRADYVSASYYSYSHGGGLALVSGSLIASNSIFLANTATGPSGSIGGGVYIDGSPFQLVNCSCAYNAPEGLYGSSGTILNSIFFWNNNSGTQIVGSPTVTYSDVQNGTTVNGNIKDAPLFQSSTDLHLSAVSPCIDAGNPAVALNDCSFPPSMGQLRNDMGAYGGPLAVPVPSQPIILSQSSQVLSCPGQSVGLLVNATGAQPLSYQWWFQDVPLPNETTNTLSLLNLTTGKTGLYRVVITNDYGSVTSAPIALIVNDFCVDLHMDHSYANLTVSGLSGTTAVLSYTTDLMKANSWAPLATNTLGAAPWFYVDLDSPGSPHRFYKATLAR